MSPKREASITLASTLNYLDRVKVPTASNYNYQTQKANPPLQKRFASQPEIYNSLLGIFQVFERDSTPSQDVFAQIAQLLRTAPDLVEDFKQFLPAPAAAHADAQAADVVSKLEKLSI